MANTRGNRNAPQTSYTRPRQPSNPMMDARYWTTTPPPGNMMSPGLLTANPNNVPRSPQNIQRRQGIADAIGGFFTQNPNNVQRSPRSTALRQGIADMFGAQQTQSPYDRYPSLPPAGSSNGATMGTVSPNEAMDFKRRVGGLNYQNPLVAPQGPVYPRPNEGMDSKRQGVGMDYQRPQSMAPQGPQLPQPTNASPFVNPMTGRVPMSPLARNAQPRDNSFMDEQEAAAADQGLIDRLDAQTRQMQAANPSVPGSPGVSPYAAQDEAMRLQEVQGRRTGQFLDDNSRAGSSTDANRIARSIPADIYNQQTAGAANGYEGNVAYANDPDRYIPMDPRTQAIQQRNAEDQTAGRPVGGGDGRFTGNNPLAQGAAQYGQDLQREARGEGVFIQPGGRGSNKQFLPFSNSRESAEQSANALAGPGNAGVRSKYDNPVLRKKQVDFAASKKAKEEQFIQETGMNYAQARREKKQDTREDGKFKRDVRRGLNPMSPAAFAAHPEAAARFRNAYAQAGKGGSKVQNPMTRAFEPGAPNTPEGNTLRTDMKTKLVTSSPTLATTGVLPNDTPVSLHEKLSAYEGDVSDEGLREIHGFIKTFEGDKDKSPFGTLDVSGQLIDEAWALPLDADLGVLRNWYDRYRGGVSSQKTRGEERARQTPNPNPVTGSPGYAAPYSQR